MNFLTKSRRLITSFSCTFVSWVPSFLIWAWQTGQSCAYWVFHPSLCLNSFLFAAFLDRFSVPFISTVEAGGPDSRAHAKPDFKWLSRARNGTWKRTCGISCIRFQLRAPIWRFAMQHYPFFFLVGALCLSAGHHLRLTRGPAGNRTTTGNLSATQECRDTNWATRTPLRCSTTQTKFTNPSLLHATQLLRAIFLIQVSIFFLQRLHGFRQVVQQVCTWRKLIGKLPCMSVKVDGPQKRACFNSSTRCNWRDIETMTK